MTTQTQDWPVTRPYKALWNSDGEYVSQLSYTPEQRSDIDQIVEAVVRGLLANTKYEVTFTDEPHVQGATT